MKILRLLIVSLVVVSVGIANANAADPVQTQMTLSADIEVDVIKAKVSDKILTVNMLLRNTTDKRAEFRGVIDDSHYIVKEENKKYHVLKDSKGMWLADPLNYGSSSAWFEVKIPASGKRLLWVRFPAPPENVNSIDLSIQGVLPFDGLTITR